MTTRNVLVKCWYPEFYDGADHAVIEVTEDLILRLDKLIAQAKAMWEDGFYGTKWWDYTPVFICCGGPESVDSEMSEEAFENALEANYYVRLPDSFDLDKHEEAGMSPVVLTVCASKGASDPIGGFYWTGTDKHVGALGRVETYEMHEDILDEWAEMISCTEMLTEERRCRGLMERLERGVDDA